MHNWLKLRMMVSKKYKPLCNDGFDLEICLGKFKNILYTSLDPQELGILKIKIDSLMTKITQNLLSASYRDKPNEKIVADFVNFRKWLATSETNMKFSKDKVLGQWKEFVAYVSIIESFMNSYLYDSLDFFSTTGENFDDILISKAGIIIEPKDWGKETFAFGKKKEEEGQ